VVSSRCGHRAHGSEMSLVAYGAVVISRCGHRAWGRAHGSEMSLVAYGAGIFLLPCLKSGIACTCNSSVEECHLLKCSAMWLL
jgi:hypothetical protein